MPSSQSRDIGSSARVRGYEGSKEVPHYNMIGVVQNPDGSLDYSRSAVRLSPEEVEKIRQRSAVIIGRIKHQIESNPDAFIDEEKAWECWGSIYDEAGNGERMDMQLNEIYAQKYEEMARLATEKMNEYERQLSSAKSDNERRQILERLIEQRDFAIEMKEEAKKRRGY
jgi:hypothetical protein